MTPATPYNRARAIDRLRIRMRHTYHLSGLDGPLGLFGSVAEAITGRDTRDLVAEFERLDRRLSRVDPDHPQHPSRNALTWRPQHVRA